MKNELDNLVDQISKVKFASNNLVLLEPSDREKCLKIISEELKNKSSEIMDVNSKEIMDANKNGLPKHVINRMKLSENSILQMAKSVDSVIKLSDPVNEVIETNNRDNGLIIKKIRVPLGVLAVIFESRPNVVVEIASLAIKSGNSLVLRGGKDSYNTNKFLFNIIQKALLDSNFPKHSMYFVESTDRKMVNRIMELDKYIDLLIPRGSASLVNLVNEKARMPAITGGIGVCHTYVDKSYELPKALDIIANAKIQNPSVCNALDTILIHKDILKEFVDPMFDLLADNNVEIRADQKSFESYSKSPKKLVKLAKNSDFGEEFLDLILSVKTVKNIDDAIVHISKYGSGHSEAIITKSEDDAKYFLQKVDAGAVFHNTSTRFNDGFEFGLGAEVAVSTDKMHARGPMGIIEIMTYKWQVFGNGQLRS